MKKKTRKIFLSEKNKTLLVFLGWWNDHRNDENFMFIKYEDIKADHYGSLEKIAKFVGKDLSPEQLQKIVDYTSFSTMKSKTQSKMGTVNIHQPSKCHFLSFLTSHLGNVE